jgi:hypothetical protein
MNQQFKKLNNIVGWCTFAIALMVYALTTEPTGSLWDCGEFISASYKLQVVHPPGAPLFLMINRMFAVVAETVSGNPENIAYAINLSSGVCTAFLVLFIFWSTTILAKLSLVGRHGEISDSGMMWSILGAGVAAGLSTTFATSVWFSAVEGEVYAMSSFFTGLVVWAGLRWYITDTPKADRWLVFISYMVGLSIGVHLLSILVAPFVALLYYYKNFTNDEDRRFPWLGTVLAGLSGMGVLVLIQNIIIPKIPAMAAGVDFYFVNTMGASVGVGLLFFAIVLGGAVAAGIHYATKIKSYHLQTWLTSFAMVLIGFSTYGMIVLRANTNIPINMNAPADPYSLLSYLNREQYGDRPLLRGPHYFSRIARDTITGIPITTNHRDVYRPVKIGNKTRYEIVDSKQDYVYEPQGMMFFPRLGHTDRSQQYMDWLGHRSEMADDYEDCMRKSGGNAEACGMFDPRNPKAYPSWANRKNRVRPTMGDNFGFFVNYQINWMYIRYFMWNFVGRQNAQQGTDGGPTQGNWISGIGFIDGLYTHNQSNLTEAMLNDKGRNTYFFLPLIFGLLGMFFHFSQRPKEAFAVLALFILTGLAIIVFLNQPPSEPRERDYAFAGSFFTFCIWIGMCVPLFYMSLRNLLTSNLGASIAIPLVLSAPIIMGVQNWDDHSRAQHYGARDYATNFLNSCAPNAIIFTYGDNDTYPLWYAQEVEGIRTDVRVVNFSLLAVDWYINQLRYKVNKSDAIKMTMPEAAYRGELRNLLPIDVQNRVPSNIFQAVKFMSETNKTNKFPQFGTVLSYIPSGVLQVPIDLSAIRKNNVIPATFPDSLVPSTLEFVPETQYWTKDDLALVDIISTNIQNGWERPIYFAVTCRPDKLAPYKDYLQLEGMALRLVPIKTVVPNTYAAMQMGRVELDTMYNNIINRFRWGNFDKVETFIDESYRPSVQSVQYSMVRLTDELIRQSDNKRATDIIDKFFAVFPHMNFPYDENRVVPQMLMYYYRVGAQDKANAVAQIVVDELLAKYNFYMSLSSDREKQAFSNDLSYNIYLLENMYMLMEQCTDTAFKDKIQKNIEAAGVKPKQPQMNPLN